MVLNSFRDGQVPLLCQISGIPHEHEKNIGWKVSLMPTCDYYW